MNDDDWMDFGLDDVEDVDTTPISDSCERIRIKRSDGRVHEFTDLNQVPPAYRDMIQDLLKQPNATSQRSSENQVRININGVEQVYDRWEDVPPEQQAQLRACGFKPGEEAQLNQASVETHDVLLPQTQFKTHVQTDIKDFADDISVQRLPSRPRRGWFWLTCRIIAIAGTLYLIWYLVHWIGQQYQDAIEAAQN